jgi:hypothetical protein
MPLYFLVLAIELKNELNVLVDVVTQIVLFEFAYIARIQWISEIRFDDTAQ